MKSNLPHQDIRLTSLQSKAALETRTVLKYPGAKWRVADWIIERMPPHKSYLEPYFGSGAVFFRKTPSRIETINDLDGNIVNLFTCIRTDAARLAGLVAATPFARQEYNAAFECRMDDLRDGQELLARRDKGVPLDQNDKMDDFESARRFLVQHWQGHGFRTYCRSGWKNDVAGREYAYAVRYWRELPDWIIRAVDRLKDAQIECRPALDLIQRFNRPDVLIYADPPYVLSTRKLKRQYRHEMTDSDHEALLDALEAHRGAVMLSGYDCGMYSDRLRDWRRYEIATTAEKGLPRTEVLWCRHAKKNDKRMYLFT